MTSIANDDVENTTADTTKEKPTKEIETEEYLARKKLANETDFTEFEKQVVIGITDNIVVFTPRAAGENPDMNLLLNYMILKLDKVVENKYNLVYCHTGRKFKKNIAKLIIVHPSFIINAGFMFARPFISSKFWKKLHRESSITSVAKILNLVQPLKVAPVVYKYEGLDEPKLYFGAPLENQEKNNNSSGELPIYLESVTSFLLNNDALNIEGIFRIPGNAKGIERYINNIENGQNLVDIYENEAKMETFSQVDHLHIIGGTLKAYLRDLPVPLFPFNSYQPLIDLMKEFNTNDNNNNMSSTTSDNDMKAKMVPKEIKFIDDGMEILNTYCDEYNMKIITYLLCFLSKCSKASAITKMQESNLAIVFAPNLLRAPLNADPMVEVSQMQDACKVLELFIKYSNDILNLNNKYNFQLNNQLDTGVGVTPLLGDAL